MEQRLQVTGLKKLKYRLLDDDFWEQESKELGNRIDAIQPEVPGARRGMN